jgi:PEP-CTERM motif
MAEAGASTPLPEPSSTVLLALGIAGLLVGRRFARKGSED